MDEFPWAHAPYFYKKWKLLKRYCRDCGKLEHKVYLVITPTSDFYVCEDCKKHYQNKSFLL